MDAGLGQLEPKCLFKVQYLNNPFFSFAVKFFSIMRRSSRKCPVVKDHEKLVATLSQKDCALRGVRDILNGVLKGPTEAEKNLVIARKHIAYYLKKLKEEGVCIEKEVNVPQPEESTPRRQEDVKVDPWDLYVQAYQWAGQEVSKRKLSSRKAASEAYLRFGINLSHTTCARTPKMRGPSLKRKGRLLLCPPMSSPNLSTSVLHCEV